MAKAEGKRSTDTVSRKIRDWSFTAACGLISFIYIGDRAHTSRHMESIAQDVGVIAKQRTLDRQDIELLKKQDEYLIQAVGSLQEEAKKGAAFRTETRIYWAAKGHGNGK